ncbi:hypothetical protein V6N12_011911 [Hibiscus sabdariffa]|uniref:S-acyltransferase n=1 Tax=Hibiscus sabdariffa TaxID=183260 RepID=A0ABR2CGM5_9ROSI
MVFLAIVSLLLAGFFAYHANLCLTNTTTNETFKWQDYVNWQKNLNEALAALNMSTTGMNTEGKPPESKCKSFFRRETEDDKENESADSIEREEAVKYSGSKVYLK